MTQPIDKQERPMKKILRRGSEEDQQQELDHAMDRLVETGYGGEIIPPWKKD